MQTIAAILVTLALCLVDVLPDPASVTRPYECQNVVVIIGDLTVCDEFTGDDDAE